MYTIRYVLRKKKWGVFLGGMLVLRLLFDSETEAAACCDRLNERSEIEA